MHHSATYPYPDLKNDRHFYFELELQNLNGCFNSSLFQGIMENRSRNVVLTLFGSTAVRLWASVGRSLRILGQAVLSRPIKHVCPVLRESTYPFILKAAHVVWGVGWVRVQEKQKIQSDIRRDWSESKSNVNGIKWCGRAIQSVSSWSSSPTML